MTDREITELTEEVLNLKRDMDVESGLAAEAVQEAQEAAQRVLQVAEERRHEYESARDAYQSRKAALMRALEGLDESE